MTRRAMTRRSCPAAPSPLPSRSRLLCPPSSGYRQALLDSTALDPSRMPGLLVPGMALAAIFLVLAGPAMANPAGGQVVGGQAAIVATDPKTLQVTQGSDRAIIEWRSFSIGADETTRFVQPSSSSVILNRVTGGDPSRIFGALTANGQVVLVNGSGILFGATAKVDVAGLVASTADIRNSDFMAGRMDFSAPGRADAAIVNKGDITVAESGLVAFVAPGVENAGRINAKLGRVALASGERFAVDLYGDGLVSLAVGPSQRAVDADGRTLSAAVANSGSIIADGGIVTLSAATASAIVDNVINSDGLIQARRVGGQGGEIVLDGGANGLVQVAGSLDASSPDGSGGTVKVLGERVELADSARLDASGAAGGGKLLVGGGWQGKGPERNARQTKVAAGAALKADATASGDGGTVVVWADGATQFAGSISARGGAAGGNGGQVETSGKQSLSVGAGAAVDAGAVAGDGGNWLLDPDNLTIADGGGGSLGGSGNQAVDASVIETTLRSGTGVTLQAASAITVDEAINGSGGASGAGSDLTMNSATVNLNAAITLHAAATLSGTASTVNVGSAGRIQNGVDVAAVGGNVNVAAGTYAAGVNLNKAGMTLSGAAGAKIQVPDAAQINGINITADNVRVQGFEIAGPATSSYLTYNWGSNISRGITVAAGADNFVIADNNIHDLRTGILIDGRNSGSNSVSGNRIENTKSGISVQYTDAAGIAIAGNGEGPIGNEWGLILHLNGYWNGTTIQSNPIAATPGASWQQALLGFSAANDGWFVQDLGYSVSNRTHVNVATAGSASAQGSALAPLNSIQNGINVVVAGGTVQVGAGSYRENLSIAKALTIDGAGIGQTVLQANVAGVGDAITIANASDVTLSDLTIRNYLYGLRMTGTSNDATVSRVAFENNTYGMRNSVGARADRFLMEDSSFSGGLIAVQTYVGTGANGSFSDALFDNVSIDGATFKGFYLETANNLTLRDVTITNTGNIGGEDPSQLHKYGHAIDINLKYGAYNALTFENLVVENSGHSSGDATRGAVVIKTRGVPGDSATYMANPASLQTVTFTGGRIEGAQGTGLRVETLLNGSGGSPTVSVGGGLQFVNNGQDIVVEGATVNATGAVFAGAADGFAIENRVTHAMDAAGRGLVTWDAGDLYVTTGTLGIQRGVDLASAGDTVHVGAGTYAEAVSIAKALTLDGAGSDQTIIDPASGTGITISGNIGNDKTVTISDLKIQGATAGGIIVDQGTTLDTLNLSGIAVVDNVGNGFHVANNSAQANLENINISDSLFAGNGTSSFIAADVNLYRYNGNATLTNVDILGTHPLSASSAGWGLQLMGGSASAAAGSVTLDDVRIAGNYRRALFGIQTFADVSGIHMTDVQVGGAAGAAPSSNSNWGGLFFSDVGGAIDIGNMALAGGSYTESWARDIALGGGTSALAVNAGAAQFAGIDRADGLSLAEGFATEARVWHALDALGAGLVRFDGGNLYVDAGTLGIQRGIDVASAGDNINVASGSYAEAVNLNKNVTLRSAGATVNDLDSTAGASVGLAGQWTVQNDASFAGAVALADDLTLDSHAANGDIAFLGAVTGRGTGGQDLTLNAGSGTVTMHNLGTSSVALGDINVQAGSYAGSAGTAHVANFSVTAGDVAVGNSTVNASGNVALSGTNVSGSIVAATATIAATGNVSSNVATSSSASVSGANVQGNMSGANVTVAATQTSSANVAATNTASVSGANVQGSVSGSNVTVAATQTSSANVAATNTASVSGANVQGTVSGANVTVAATETANTTVVASNSASVSGNNVQGSVQAPTATVTATQTVNIQVDTDNLTVSAPSGSVSGDAGTVHVTGSGVLDVNNETTTSVDSNVGRASGVLDPNAVLAPELSAPAALSPSSLAFAGGAGDVFSYSFSLGAAPVGVQPAAGGESPAASDGESVPALDSGDASVAAYFGDFWSYFGKEGE